MSDFDQVERQLFTLNRYKAARTHADWFSRYGELYREKTAAVVRTGQRIDRGDYLLSVREQRIFRGRMADVTTSSGIDLWITPAADGPAPLGLSTTGNSIMCLPWSFAGMPSLAVPAGVSAAGLPPGVQCVGRRGDDERVLARSLPAEAAFQPTAQ
jgi:Asp-tRNA(Asn)/Glu-tRNA(Gln) amidotransferase A subunit family amidase